MLNLVARIPIKPTSLCLALITMLWIVIPTQANAQMFTASTLGDYGNVTVMEVTGSYDAQNADGTENDVARQTVAKEFFRTHKDEYDFLVFFSNFDYQMPTDARAFYQGIRNDISGIGKPLFDNSSLYNGSGKLQGTVDMGNIALLATDPMDPKFNETLYILPHEIMHRWGAYAKFKDASGADSSALLGRNGAHWSFLLDSGGSLLYGNKWRDNGNNTFTSLAPQTELKYYSPLDLYLMGMVDKSQVPPMLLIENSTIDPNRLPEAGVTITGSSKTVTIDDIIAAMGERVPSAAASQKSFKTAFVFLARPGTFTGQEIYGIENIRNGAVTRFSVLTDGRSIMEVALTPRDDVPANPGVLPPSTTLRPMANIDEGVTWLTTNQRTDGGWMDLAQTMERDTAEAVLTLKPFPAAQTSVQAGLLWLGSSQSLNIDYLCRKIEAVAASGADVSALVSDLLGRQNSDGGWGSERTYTSNAADTALALKAMSIAGAIDQQAINKAIQYLLSAQKPVGGWTGNGESTIQATAAALSALNRYRTSFLLEDAIGRGTEWLLSQKRSGGGFGPYSGSGQETSVYDTALAILVLRELDAATNITNPAVDFLKARQDVNGSWNSSVFETALAVKAILKGNVDPDLVVRPSDITFTPVKISALPSSVVINVAVSNTGLTAVPQAKVVLYDGAVTAANKIGEKSLAVPGQSTGLHATIFQFSTSISDGNEHTFIAVVDPDNLVKESNKSNNQAGRSLQVQQTFDFEILSGDVSVSPATTQLLQDVAISAKISNKGTKTAYSVPVKFYVTAPGGEVTIAEVPVDIPANGNVTKIVTWRANRAGTDMPVIIQVVPSDRFPELSITNNSASTLVTINSLTEPNVSVSYKELVVTPDTLLEGGSATISAIVRNDGGSAVSDVAVKFYSTVSGTTRQLPQDAPATRTIPLLEPGQSGSVFLTWNNIPDPGSTVITVKAYPPAGTSEIRMDDNEAFTTVMVKSLPELAISANAISIQPAFPHEGDLVTIAVTVQNSGDRAAADVKVRALEGATPIGPDQTITLLSGHATATVNFSYGATVSKGTHEITVVVDPLNSITERNKENNRATRSFGVQDADLFVSERYFSPNGDGVKDATELFFRLPSPQTVTVSMINKKGETVRTFGGPELTSVRQGNVAWDGMNNEGLVADDGEYDLTLKNDQKVTLGIATVSLDTNRFPLVAAVGTKYLRHQLLNCSITDIQDRTWLPDDSGILFTLSRYSTDAQYPAGIYIMSPSSGDITEIVSVKTDTSDTQYPVHEYQYELTADGKTLVYVRNRMTHVNQLPVSSQIWKYDFETGRSEIIANYDLSAFYVAMTKLSPDGKYLFLKLIHASATAGELRILKTDGTINNLIDAIYPYLGYEYVQWSPDSSKVSFAYTQYEYLPAYGYGNYSYIAVADVSGNQWFLLTGAGSPVDAIEWVNDRKILAILPWSAEYRIYDAANADSHVLLGGNTAKGAYAVSPDRSSIAYVQSPYGEVQTLYSADENGISRKLYETSTGLNADLRNIMWSPNSSKLSFIEEQTTDWPNNQITDYLKRLDVTTGTVSQVYASANYMQPVKWMSDKVTAVTMIGSGLYTINMGSGSTALVLEDAKLIEASVSPQEQAFIYSKYRESSSSCLSGTNIWSAMSLLNLTADFGIAPGVNEITIRGTAMDLNFSDYSLEYADIKSPASWIPIQPVSDQPVINNVLGTWTPPSPGTYLVRLVSQDKAGNSKTSRKRATWGRRDVISGLSLSRKMFSPQSGGSGSTVSLQYQVSEPVHLTFTISDAHGAVIRTILRDHAVAGNGSMLWDGLDDQLTTVPEGVYTLSVLGYMFSVEVDTTLPSVSARASLTSKPDLLQPTLKRYLAQVTGYVYDKNIKQWTISYGEGDDPQIWTEIGKGSDVKAALDEQGTLILPRQETSIYEFGEPALGLLGGKKLRVLVEDLAGNRSAAVTNFLEDNIIIHTWDEGYVLNITSSEDDIKPEQARPGIHAIGGFETIRRPLSGIHLQYYLSPDVWADGPAGTEVAPGIFTFAWDTGNLNLQAIRIRVKAIDVQGTGHYSNVLSTKEAFELVRTKTSCSLKATNSVFEELASLRFLITDPNDLSRSTYHEFSAMGGSYSLPVRYGEFSVPLPELLTGVDYHVKMIGTGRSGSIREAGSTIRSCDTASINVAYKQAGCNEQSGYATLSANLSAGSPFPITARKVGYSIQVAGQWVLLKELAVQGAAIPSLEIGTANYAEGRYPVKAVITYVSGVDSLQSIYAESTLGVDRVLPVANLTYPASGSRVCTQAVQSANGTEFFVPLKGEATDNRGFGKYEISYGQGDQPSSWLSANVSDNKGRIGELGNWKIDTIMKKTLGPTSLKIEAEDAAGNRSCAFTSFTFDNTNEVSFTGNDVLYMSPNGEGTAKTISINYRLDEPSTIDANVYELSALNDQQTGSSTPIAILAAGVRQQGNASVTWNGSRTIGGLADEGRYKVVIKVADDCGNSRERSVAVVIDKTRPQAEIVRPVADETLNGIVEVRGTVDDSYLASYELYVGSGDTPADWEPVASGSVGIRNAAIGAWKAVGKTGRWTFRLAATDLAGNNSVKYVTVNISNSPGAITKMTIAPRVISPNGDRKRETATVDFDISGTAEIFMEVVNSAGGIVSRSTSSTLVDGSYQKIFYGKSGNSDAGNKLDDGDYQIKLYAAVASNPSSTVVQIETVTSTIDTAPPSVSVTMPVENSYVKNSSLIVRGTISDPNLYDAKIMSTGATGSVLVYQGSQQRTDYAFGVLDNLSDGLYVLSITAKDLGENETVNTIPFTVDRTPPVVKLDAPKDGASYGTIVSVVSGSTISSQPSAAVSVAGSIAEQNLDTFTLRYGSGDNPTSWTDIVTGVTITALPSQYAWNVGAIQDGVYTLSLLATDKAGLKGEARVRVIVDNTPPAVAIASPQNGGYVKAAFDVTGTAADQNLDKYTVEVSEGLCATAFKWVQVKKNNSPVTSGALASLQALPSDGDYCLRVTAVDKIGSSASATIGIKMDKTPPAPPVLDGTRQNVVDAKLTWSGNTETDLAGFNVYRGGQKLNTGPTVTAGEFIDAGLGEGSYVYTVKSIDLAGNESGPSNAVKIRIDLTGSAAKITKPLAGAMVGGFIDIKGTAFSSDDFKQYRVSIGQGTAPATWSVIRTSPVAVSNGVLADLDTLGLAEKQIYTIKLEAEDLTGNITTDRIAITIDNTAPNAPDLALPVVDGASVTLQWSNSQGNDDLAGYLLFVNDRLVNAPSNMTQADMTPYLISCPSFYHYDLPDGKFTYTVAAVDHAGNMGPLSLPAEVKIDTRAPQIAIVEPASILVNGQRTGAIGGKTLVRVESPDLDITTVNFYYSIDNGSTWPPLGSLSREPYSVSFVPVDVGMSYGGSVLLKAEAFDKLPNDPNRNRGESAVITLTYQDLTPPPVPAGLSATVNRNTVSILWTAATDTDTVQYKLYRTLGSERVRATSTLLQKQTAAYQDVRQTDGAYSYDITAVDASGNESKASAPVTARVYAPVIDPIAERIRLNTVHITGSNATSLASVRFAITSQSTTSTVIAAADQSGRFSADITLHAGINTVTVTATDNAGNVSNASNVVSVELDALPAAPRDLSASVQGSSVTLTWNKNQEADVVGYFVYRKTGAEWSKLTQSAVSEVPWTDAGLRNGSYQYKVTAVDAMGEGPASFTDPLTVAVNLLDPPVNMAAIALPDGKADITWEHPAGTAAGYHLYRGTVNGGPYTRISSKLVSVAAYQDRGLVHGTAYYYVATAVDAPGNESSYANPPASVTALDTTAPAQPVITAPTSAGSPIVVATPTVLVSGTADPGATVELFRNGASLGEVLSSVGQGDQAISLGTSVSNIAVSPDGIHVAFYRSGSLRLLDREAVTEKEIAPAGTAPVWSPDGHLIAYVVGDALNIYDLASGSTVRTISAAGVHYYSPSSWSLDGRIIAVRSYDRLTFSNTTLVFDLGVGPLLQLAALNGIAYHKLSPDGTKLAYFSSSTLSVLDLATGGQTVVASGTDGNALAWASDTKRIIYRSPASANGGLYLAELDKGTTTHIDGTTATDTWFQWVPGNDAILLARRDAVDGSYALLSYPVSGQGGPAMVMAGVQGLVYFDAHSDGTLFYAVRNLSTNETYLHWISSGGRFSFADIALGSGENIFTSVAKDASGNKSPASQMVSVTFTPSDRPDLVASTEDIAFYPAAPIAGERVVIGAVIGNKGQIASSGTDVSVYVWNEGGNLDLIFQGAVPALDPDAVYPVSAEWNSTGKTGASRIVVVVDAEQTVTESDEANNMAVADFYVSDHEGASLAMIVDASQYTSDSVVSARVTIRNSGIPKTGSLSVRIEDENGLEVTVLGEQSLSLAYASQQDLTFTWNTGSTYAGSYRVHAVLSDTSGSLAEKTTPFTIIPDTNIGMSVTTDKASYGASEPVNIAVTLNNLGRNRIIPLITTRLTITNEAGAVLFSNEKNTTDMLPGASISLSSVWNTDLSPAGSYTAILETVVDGSPLPVKSARFAVRGSAVVTGTLFVSPDPVPFGAAFRVAYGLENSGNAAIGPGTARIMIIDQESQAVLGSFENQTALVSGGTITGQADFSGLSNSLKTYAAVLHYISGGGTSVLASTTVAVKDMTAPTLNVLSPVEGTPYTSTVVFLVAASADASGVDRIEYSRDGGSWSLLPVADPSRGRFGTTWDPTMADNGPHRVSFRATDRAGNTSMPVPVTFAVQINTLAPTAVITGSPSSPTKATGATLTVGGTDVVAYKYKLDDAAYSPETVVAMPIELNGLSGGNHTVWVVGRNAAGSWQSESNATTTTWVVDVTPPVLTLSTLSDGSITNNVTLNVAGTATDNISVQGVTINETAVLLNPVGTFSQAVSLATGLNTITTIAVDTAGNTATDIRTIVLDQTAPVITIASPIDNSVVSNPSITVSGTTDKTTTVLVSINSGPTVTAAANAATFSLPVTLASNTNNTIFVYAIDLAGNSSTAKRSVTHDDISPALAVTNPAQDMSTNQPGFLLQGTVADIDATTVTVALDGTIYTPAITNGSFRQQLTFTEEKQYQVIVTAMDAAGNSTTVQRNIIFDKTPPGLTIDPVKTPTNSSQQLVTGGMDLGSIVTVMCQTAAAGVVSHPTATTWQVIIANMTEGENVLSVTATDQVGNTSLPLYATIVLDTKAAETRILAGPAALTNQNAASFTFDATEHGSTFECKFDNGNYGACVSPMNYTSLIDGTHTFMVRATDPAGNTDQTPAVYTWNVDTIPPIAVISGAPSSLTNARSASLTVTGDDVVAYQYQLGSGVFSAETSVSTPIVLSGLLDGMYKVLVVGKDSAGNWQQQAFATTAAWTVDITPPALTVSTLPDGSYTNNPVLNIAGTTSDANGIQTVVVSGQTVTPSTSDNVNYTFSQAVSLATGLNTITAYATDNAGNTTADTRNIVLDRTAPVITITSPADNSLTNSAAVNITGFVDKTAIVSIKVNGVSVLPDVMTSSTFTFPVTLAYNGNQIDVTAVDLANNSGSAKRTVILDNLNPALAITSPNQDMGTNRTDILLSGTMSDLTAVSLIVTCPTASIGVVSTPTSTTWNVSLTNMQQGTNAVTVTATDEAGNSTSVVRNIISSPTPITIDPVRTPTNNSQQLITGTMELASTVTVSCSKATVGTITYPTTTTWQVIIADMTEGANVISATATDLEGRTSDPVFATIVLDIHAPITTPSPAQGTYYNVLTATLAANEPATIYYTIDGTTPTASSAVYNAPLLLASTTTLNFFAVDMAMNAEAVKSAAYAVIPDTTLPVTTITAGNPNYTSGDGKLSVTSSSRFTLSATDTMSGVAATGYRLDVGTWTTYTSPFSLATEGSHTIGYRSIDNASNTESDKSLGVMVDNTPPVSAITIGAPPVTVSTSITIAATDSASGVQRTEYAIDGASWTTYNGVFTLAAYSQGTHTITYRSTDNVGNIETPKSRIVQLWTELPTITTAVLADGTAGAAYSQTVAATGGTAPYLWSVVTGTLPAGLQLNSTTGTISGTPLSAGTATVTFQAADVNTMTGAKVLSLTVYGPVSITTSALASGTTGSTYSQTLAAIGGKTPYIWTIVAGTLPSGLSLNAATGVISGTPISAGTSTFTVQVKDANHATTTKPLSIAISAPLTISTVSLPTGTTGTAYSQTLTATGGLQPYLWSTMTGTLPAGLSLNNSTGIISGTPTTAGTSTFTAQVRDANNATSSKVLALTISSGLSIPQNLGVFGATGVSMSGGYVDSYDSTQGAYSGVHGSNVSIGTNSIASGAITLSGGVVDYGNAYVGPGGNPANAIATSGGAVIYGIKGALSMARNMTPMSDPGGGTPANFINGTILTSGTYRVSSINLSGSGKGTINGNVTLYVTGSVNLSGSSQIVIMPGGSLTIYINGSLNVSGGSLVNQSLNPHKLTIYGTSTCTSANYSGSGALYGVMYTPAARTSISGLVNVYGSVIGRSIAISGGAAVHYDASLGNIGN